MLGTDTTAAFTCEGIYAYGVRTVKLLRREQVLWNKMASCLMIKPQLFRMFNFSKYARSDFVTL